MRPSSDRLGVVTRSRRRQPTLTLPSSPGREDRHPRHVGRHARPPRLAIAARSGPRHGGRPARDRRPAAAWSLARRRCSPPRWRSCSPAAANSRTDGWAPAATTASSPAGSPRSSGRSLSSSAYWAHPAALAAFPAAERAWMAVSPLVLRPPRWSARQPWSAGPGCRARRPQLRGASRHRRLRRDGGPPGRRGVLGGDRRRGPSPARRLSRRPGNRRTRAPSRPGQRTCRPVLGPLVRS